VVVIELSVTMPFARLHQRECDVRALLAHAELVDHQLLAGRVRIDQRALVAVAFTHAEDRLLALWVALQGDCRICRPEGRPTKVEMSIAAPAAPRLRQHRQIGIEEFLAALELGALRQELDRAPILIGDPRLHAWAVELVEPALRIGNRDAEEFAKVAALRRHQAERTAGCRLKLLRATFGETP
jgi:hypothetical protein